jgi:chaperonin GroES
MASPTTHAERGLRRTLPRIPRMSTPPTPRKQNSRGSLEVVEPVGKRVLIRKDEDKKQTKSGIHLPDKVEIPTLTGRVVAVSAQVASDEAYPIRRYDRVLFHPKHAVPVDFEGDNRLFVVPIEDVVAVFRREGETGEGSGGGGGGRA